MYVYNIFNMGTVFFGNVSFTHHFCAQTTIADSLSLFDNHTLTCNFIQQMYSLFSNTDLTNCTMHKCNSTSLRVDTVVRFTSTVTNFSQCIWWNKPAAAKYNIVLWLINPACHLLNTSSCENCLTEMHFQYTVDDLVWYTMQITFYRTGSLAITKMQFQHCFQCSVLQSCLLFGYDDFH
jgi:predicted membrane channel-forming protein YqfA (hemolysin III family)